ncbi:DUF1604-domain-containing protein [Rhizodiscina lignyota]|uniref:DUF1604-domain-containing protein n=1 Tax=Rhizodiscina lignyota TaxID=1504668 RepID=A0A9P4I410_9PEZI|nr:DUF1604-domain-containing protein [Rhizodiscina lignyota]
MAHDSSKRRRSAFEQDDFDELDTRPYLFLRPLTDPKLETNNEFNELALRRPKGEQRVLDERGQPKRFHGAFEGGFSAGYYGTVGSKEGFQPASFVSSRDARAKGLNTSLLKPTDYMDEEDLQEHNRDIDKRPLKFVHGAGFAAPAEPVDLGPAKKDKYIKSMAIAAKVLVPLGLELEGGVASGKIELPPDPVEFYSGDDDEGMSVRARAQAALPYRIPLHPANTPYVKTESYGLGYTPLTGVKKELKGPAKDLLTARVEQENSDTERRNMRRLNYERSKTGKKRKKISLGLEASDKDRVGKEGIDKGGVGKGGIGMEKLPKGGIGVGVLNSDDEEDEDESRRKLTFDTVMKDDEDESRPKLLSYKPLETGEETKAIEDKAARRQKVIPSMEEEEEEGFQINVSKILQEKQKKEKERKRRLRLQQTDDPVQDTSTVAAASNNYVPVNFVVQKLFGSAWTPLSDGELKSMYLNAPKVFEIPKDEITWSHTAEADTRAAPAAAEAEKPANVPSNFPALSKEWAHEAMTNHFQPYRGDDDRDDEKSERYQIFLRLYAGYSAELPKKPDRMDDEEYGMELEEFAACARMFRPAKGQLAQKFMPLGVLPTESAWMKRDLREEAAEAGAFGPLTRDMRELDLSRLLLKRWGEEGTERVKPPPRSKKEKEAMGVKEMGPRAHDPVVLARWAPAAVYSANFDN